jgi:toxin-antitoxin system PIN domain toxin
MIYLSDVNVWIAFVTARHVHHTAARHWFESLDSEQVTFCRITELGLLRLLTNSHVMGVDVLEPVSAWRAYDTLRADPRVLFLAEQAGFSEYWRKAGESVIGGPNVWTDAYPGALAAHADLTVVTFDRGFRAAGNCRVHKL